MTRRPWTMGCVGAVWTVVTVAGCGGGTTFDAGERAERRGEYHIAYERYVRAAARAPNSRRVATALRRIAPKAAGYWESQGRIAEGEGRHADAWRMYMRGLDIRPNDHTLVGLIRHLSNQRPERIADARREWMGTGRAALATASTAGEEGVGGDETVPTAVLLGPVASRERGDAASPIEVTAPAPVPTGSEAVLSASVFDGAGGFGTESVSAPTDSVVADAEWSRESAPADTDTAAMGQGDAPASTRVQADPSPVGPASQLDAALRSEQRAKPPQTDGPAEPEHYLVVHTLSRRDRRFVKKVETVDGIAIKLKDTDHERDADLSLYLGKKRIRKIKDIRVGQSADFRGKSGQRFKLVVLFIHHKSRTVRLGVKRL